MFSAIIYKLEVGKPWLPTALPLAHRLPIRAVRICPLAHRLPVGAVRVPPLAHPPLGLRDGGLWLEKPGGFLLGMETWRLGFYFLGMEAWGLLLGMEAL